MKYAQPVVVACFASQRFALPPRPLLTSSSPTLFTTSFSLHCWLALLFFQFSIFFHIFSKTSPTFSLHHFNLASSLPCFFALSCCPPTLPYSLLQSISLHSVESNWVCVCICVRQESINTEFKKQGLHINRHIEIYWTKMQPLQTKQFLNHIKKQQNKNNILKHIF